MWQLELAALHSSLALDLTILRVIRHTPHMKITSIVTFLILAGCADSPIDLDERHWSPCGEGCVRLPIEHDDDYPPYLCKTEQASYVGLYEGEFMASGYEDSSVWLITKDQVQLDGGETNLNSCRYENGRPVFCESDGDVWLGAITISEDRVFKLVAPSQSQERLDGLISFIGRCVKVKVTIATDN